MTSKQNRRITRFVEIAAAAVKELGAPGCFVAVDESGQVFCTNIVGKTDSLPFSPRDVAIAKARLAAQYGVPTSELVENPTLLGDDLIETLEVWAGGLPIFGANGNVTGGVAFSGLGQWTDEAYVSLVILLEKAWARDVLEDHQREILSKESES